MVSKTSGRMIPHTTPQKEELPITSMADHSESKPTSHLIQQQESNIYEDDDDKSALWSPLSFQTYEYRTPSKATFKISRESSQSLSPIQNKSINTEKSHESFRSRNISSKNDVKLDQSTSNTVQNDDKQSLIESINQNPNPSQTYVNKFDKNL